MAAPRKLKVFRTAIGFHDAYVAAPSRKAALTAWGADADLFARGVAEEVTDAALTVEPLAQPGVVVKRSRGTVAEQLAALPPDPVRAPTLPREAKRPVRPSRAALEAAERALAEAAERGAAALDSLAAREAQLARERAALERQQAAERDRLASERDAAREQYEAATAAWSKA